MVGKNVITDHQPNVDSFGEDPGNMTFNTPSFLVGMDATEVSVTDHETVSSEEGSQLVSPTTKTRPSARSVLKTTWRVVLGTAAFLDCISTVLPGQLALQTCDAEDSPANEATCALGKLTAFGIDFTLSNSGYWIF